ncbi:MAG TPA: ThuA domain-containing protein [Verrucomicrobiae bacterium]|nr:ThuA domain-containing protein [Verrucomicrobiae bacterium]
MGSCKFHTLAALSFTLVVLLLGGVVAQGQTPEFRALAFYSTNVEPDHVRTGNEGLAFFRELAAKENFAFDTTTDWDKLNDTDLKSYQVILWINDFPHTATQRAAFENYMEHGGGWLGLHVAAYNDASTNWPWFVNFLGGAVFYTNNWPVQRAKMVIDDPNHPVTKGMPASYLAPSNEWYQWKPSPRLDKDVRVLVTLDPSNYPIGVKDVITQGDMPIVWTNTKYRMLYMNMGHGEGVFADPTQNQLFANAILWLGKEKPTRASQGGER